MKKTLLSLSIAAAAVSVPAQAADIGGGFDLSGNMALTSNYIWRGYSQSDDDPAIQGGLDLAHESGVYAGVWASNVESGDYAGAEMELDLYAGYATELAGVGVDVGFLSYNYPSSTPSSDFEEIYAGVSKSFGPADLGYTYYWGQDGLDDYWQIDAGTELAGFGISAAYGDADKFSTHYSFTVSKEVLSASWPVEVSLMYYDFDADAGASSDEDGVVFTVAKSF